ncbi:unnamed protein product [Porites lobata]|uniref:G-protein coupled receptors family 1 profile domain-containing protein n=1 Tax=Porites lobata TaxID=104759 RepID=A0ABN8NKA1_9CNID|nr:unnamed protein product [Porites lobata]
MRTCDFAHSFLGTTDFNSCFDGCPSPVLSQKVRGDDIVFLELLCHHLFILYDRSISAQVQEEKKGPKSPNAFRKVYFAQGVRVAYILAIATGVFTVCWVPVKTMRFVIGMRPNSPLHMWLRTLAVSNSVMNFLIYSARMRAFEEAYLSIFRL